MIRYEYNDLLNPRTLHYLRVEIISTPIFPDDQEQKRNFNLFWAILDRLESAAHFINRHTDTPKNEEEFILFLVFCCIIKDGVVELFKSLLIKYPYKDDKKYFQNICYQKPLELKENDCPSDDKFFEYIRTLAFAHPFDTNRPKFFKKGEKQYSPFVIAGMNSEKGEIGVRAYSNKVNNILDIIIPFELLKKYIQSRYELLNLATEKIEEIILEKKNIWKDKKVNRNLNTLGILRNIMQILIDRHEDHFIIDIAIKYLTTKLTIKDNEANVNKFRKAIAFKLPIICNAVDEMDYLTMEFELNSIIENWPKNLHPYAHYELEKIFYYLNNTIDRAHQNFGIKMTNSFYKQFAYKWVKIDTDHMSYDEIKLLVATACYLETHKNSEV